MRIRIAVQTIWGRDMEGYPKYEDRYYIEGENNTGTGQEFDEMIKRHQSYNPKDKIRVFYIEEIKDTNS